MVKTLVIRLSNPRAQGLDEKNRIQNEVAVMSLAREALKGVELSHIVPVVYGWGTVEEEQEGWILMQALDGINIMDQRPWTEMGINEKQLVLSQMADIASALQTYPLPSTVTRIGGLNIEKDGTLTSALMTLSYGGPFQDCFSYWHSILNKQLEEADGSSVVRGWRNSNVRTRVENFIESPAGLKKAIDLLGPVCKRRSIVHADLTTDNLLFNPETLQVTALLDFDFSYIGNPADEFLRSFGTNCYSIPGPFSEGDEQILRTSILTGTFPKPLPRSSEEARETQWDVAACFEAELSKRQDFLRPSVIPQFEQLVDLNWFSDSIAPFRLCCEAFVQRRTLDSTEELRKKMEVQLAHWLGERGF